MTRSTWTTLPNGAVLYQWTDVGGSDWCCAASDHGPFCRLCQRVTPTLALCLDNVHAGLFEISGVTPTGDLLFNLTPEGHRRAESLTGDTHP